VKTIVMKDEDGRDICLVLNPSKGDLLTRHQLIQLKPYIEHAIKLDCKHDTYPKLVADKLNISEENGLPCFSFSDLTRIEQARIKHILAILVCSCANKISERLIVPQLMTNGPTIHHRPLHFNAETGTITVRYSTLGDFNNFDAAMAELKSIYPEVKTEPDFLEEDNMAVSLSPN
jgi:hypothetical protein